ESVVDRRAAARPPAGIRLDDRRPSSVGEDVVELRDTRPEMIIRVPLDPAQGGWRVHIPEGGRGSITRRHRLLELSIPDADATALDHPVTLPKRLLEQPIALLLSAVH